MMSSYNIYEELKKGKSEEEIAKEILQTIAETKEKIQKEKEKAEVERRKKEEINQLRKEAVAAVIKYLMKLVPEIDWNDATIQELCNEVETYLKDDMELTIPFLKKFF